MTLVSTRSEHCPLNYSVFSVERPSLIGRPHSFDSIHRLRHTSHWLMNDQTVYDPFHRSKNLTIIQRFYSKRRDTNRMDEYEIVLHCIGVRCSYGLRMPSAFRSFCFRISLFVLLWRPIRATVGFFFLWYFGCINSFRPVLFGRWLCAERSAWRGLLVRKTN